MQGVSELVEHGEHLVDAQVFGKVRDIDYDRAHVVALCIHILVAHIVHPGTSPLAVAGEVVGREYAYQGTVVSGYLIGGDLGIVGGDALQLLGIHAVEGLGRTEHTVHHIVYPEVGPGLRLVEVVLRLAHLLGIVPPVPLLYLRALGKLPLLYVLVHKGLALATAACIMPSRKESTVSGSAAILSESV